MAAPARMPSARVLDGVTQNHLNRFESCVRPQCIDGSVAPLGLPGMPEQQARYLG